MGRAIGAGRQTRRSVGVFGENSAAVCEAEAGERSRPMCCSAILPATIRPKAQSTKAAKRDTHRQDHYVLKPLPVRPGKPLSFGMLVATSGFVPHGAPEQWCCLTWQGGEPWYVEAGLVQMCSCKPLASKSAMSSKDTMAAI